MNKKETNAKFETEIAASPYYSYCQRCTLAERTFYENWNIKHI